MYSIFLVDDSDNFDNGDGELLTDEISYQDVAIQIAIDTIGQTNKQVWVYDEKNNKVVAQF